MNYEFIISAAGMKISTASTPRICLPEYDLPIAGLYPKSQRGPK
jgi:hypothetical protein